MLSRKLKNFIKLPLQQIKRSKAKLEVRDLISSDFHSLKLIGEALQETLTRNLTKEEKNLISKIEERRESLLNSNEIINMLDFGAGDADSNRTKEEMEKGVEIKVPLSKITEASKPEFCALFLYKLIRKLRPVSCIELGSCVGISGSYIATALQLNKTGKLYTLEGAPEIAKIAGETFEIFNLKNVSVVTGPFQKTLVNVLEKTAPVDFFFNDGHHDHDAVLEYFKLAFPYLKNEAVMVFDDISWSKGMREAWIEIEENANVAVSVDFGKIGIAVITKTQGEKKKFRIPL